MTRFTKVLIVLGGYGVALFTASAVTRAHVAATSGPNWQDSSGMLAFGDAVLFIGVFGLATLAGPRTARRVIEVA